MIKNCYKKSLVPGPKYVRVRNCFTIVGIVKSKYYGIFA